MNNQNKRLLTSSFLILTLVSTIFAIYKGPIVSLDTKAFLRFFGYFSGGYPFFINGLRAIFNDSYQVVAVGVQLVLVVSSIGLFMKCFLEKFSLKSYQLLLLMLLLFYPIFDSNVYAVNNLTTEGISYAIFLQIITLGYLAFTTEKIKYYLLLVLLTVGLVLIRGQFKYLFLLYLLILGVKFYKVKRIQVKPILLLLLIPLLTSGLDRLYHKVVHKETFATPFTWVALNTSVMFVSDESDIQYVESEDAREVFKRIHQQFREKNLGYKDHKYHEEPIDFNYAFYHYEFPTLCNQTVHEVAMRYYVDKIGGVNKVYVKADEVHKELFLALFPHNFWKWLDLTVQNFKSSFGGITIIILFIVGLLLSLQMFLKTGNEVFFLGFFLLALFIINKAVVSISVHGITRYFFYTNWIPIFLLFLGLNRIKKTH